MEVLQTKYIKDKVFIDWVEGETEKTLNDVDSPRPEYFLQLSNLRHFVLECLEYDDKKTVDDIEVIGVTFKYSKKTNIMSAKIHYKLRLIGINKIQPGHLPFLPESNESGGYELPTGVVKTLENIMEECNKYVNGDRAQINMFPVGIENTLINESSPESDYDQPQLEFSDNDYSFARFNEELNCHLTKYVGKTDRLLLNGDIYRVDDAIDETVILIDSKYSKLEVSIYDLEKPTELEIASYLNSNK